MSMCAANTKATTDPAGNRKLDKAKSTGRIDGILAIAMVLSVATWHEVEPEWSPMVDVF